MMPTKTLKRERRAVAMVACPMDKAVIEYKNCEPCPYKARVLACPELNAVATEDYCARYCPHQKGVRGPQDPNEPRDMSDGPERMAPLAGPAMCGGPKVLRDHGRPMPIFEPAGGLNPFHDTRHAVKPACRFPKMLEVMTIRLEV